jgi:lipoprotein-releasing system permease protein
MAFTLFVARRTLRRRSLTRVLSFMTTVAAGGVAVGTAALIVTFAVLDGFERDLTANIVRFAAHVQVGTFRTQLVRDDPATRRTLLAVPGVADAAPYLQREAVLATGSDIDGVVLKGLAPGYDAAPLARAVTAGRFRTDTAGGTPSLVVGRRLADRLGLAIGSRVVVFGVTAPRDILSAPKIVFTVRGVYETGMAEYFDGVFVFTALASAQEVFGAPGRIDGYDVHCTDVSRIGETALRIREALGYPFDPQAITDIYRNLFVWIALQQELIPVVTGSLILIAAFNVVSTLLLFVMEKTRNIGVLRALGATRGQVRGIFLAQGAWIGGTGALAGAALAFAFCFLQERLRFFHLPPDVYYMTSVPIHMSPAVFGLVVAAAVALSVLSALVPAWLAARLRPVSTIRFR